MSLDKISSTNIKRLSAFRYTNKHLGSLLSRHDHAKAVAMDSQRGCKPETHQKSVSEILKKRFATLTARDHRVLAADLLAIPEHELKEALRSRNCDYAVATSLLNGLRPCKPINFKKKISELVKTARTIDLTDESVGDVVNSDREDSDIEEMTEEEFKRASETRRDNVEVAAGGAGAISMASSARGRLRLSRSSAPSPSGGPVAVSGAHSQDAGPHTSGGRGSWGVRSTQIQNGLQPVGGFNRNGDVQENDKESSSAVYGASRIHKRLFGRTLWG